MTDPVQVQILETLTAIMVILVSTDQPSAIQAWAKALAERNEKVIEEARRD